MEASIPLSSMDSGRIGAEEGLYEGFDVMEWVCGEVLKRIRVCMESLLRSRGPECNKIRARKDAWKEGND